MTILKVITHQETVTPCPGHKLKVYQSFIPNDDYPSGRKLPLTVLDTLYSDFFGAASLDTKIFIPEEQSVVVVHHYKLDSRITGNICAVCPKNIRNTAMTWDRKFRGIPLRRGK
jgi:hypothetical protein